MIKTIKIGDKDVAMRADGATPYLYKLAFGGDLISYFANPGDEGDNADMANKLAYVMARQAEEPHPASIKLSEADMVDWLTQFGPLDITLAAQDVLQLYLGTTVSTSTAKKNSDQQKDA